MSAEKTDENGIQPEFNFYNQSKDASVYIENHSSIADQACFGEIGQPYIVGCLRISRNINRKQLQFLCTGYQRTGFAHGFIHLQVFHRDITL